jgi:hypothetical protein
MSTPSISMTSQAATVESSTSFKASSLVQVVVKPSPAASKSARGYRDFRMPRVRLVNYRMFVRMISQDRLSRLANI